MTDSKNKFHIIQKSHWQITGILILVLSALFLLWFNNTNSYQAVNAFSAKVQFWGEYRIEDGEWKTITEDKHIPSTQGDVTLRGNFHMIAPDGEYVGIYSGDTPIAFYCNHIHLTFHLGNGETIVGDIENPLFGSSVCGAYWVAYTFTDEAPIEITIHNSHAFGNEKAIDELLADLAFWSGIDFERDMMERGRLQRNTGLFFVIISLILIGSALFSALLHIPNIKIIWLFGATILSAGIYLAYSSFGVSFWSERFAVNTSVLGFSMMFYMLLVSGIITHSLNKTKNIGYFTMIALSITTYAYFILPVLMDINFYDTWLVWVITQSIANVVLFICLIKEFRISNKKERLLQIYMASLLISFEVDVIATATGLWSGGFLSKYVFFLLFAAALFVVLRLIPDNINAATKARKLEIQRNSLEAEKNLVEAQLKDSRISIMLSQIQPHFIYNTLGTIERMCLKDPQKAFDLVRNFSLYLRGNFSELDSVTPIRFTEEFKHVEYYVNIEKVRFPDMNIEYNIEVTDFVLPALSVQPLVENAIKHGLMRLESGGTVQIHTYETPAHYCVEVKDNGAGFDTSLPLEEKKHVGLRNIRGRLKAMVNGELFIESQIGVGTKAVIMIPKEVTE